MVDKKIYQINREIIISEKFKIKEKNCILKWKSVLHKSLQQPRHVEMFGVPQNNDGIIRLINLN